jgi:hypothetical protein
LLFPVVLSLVFTHFFAKKRNAKLAHKNASKLFIELVFAKLVPAG